MAADTQNPSLRVKTHGIMLGTERFQECVRFYRDILGLPIWFEKDHLVCLRFCDGYLMIESGGVASNGRKPNQENPTMLRLNVESVERAAAELGGKGVSVEIKRFSWGTVGTFIDPDGNACELKNVDDPFFS